MGKEFKYQLDNSSRKFPCPECGQKRLVRYIDQDKQFLSEKVGRCDRESNCGYHYTPKQHFTDNPALNTSALPGPRIPSKEHSEAARPIKYLQFEIMDASVTKHHRCNIYPFLNKIFRAHLAAKLCENYFIGTNKDGNTVFWQVDIKGLIRQAKVMQYNSDTGRRNKETGAIFAGKKILGDTEANLQQCFFGEFLLSFSENDSKPVAIVESEKTAAISSVYFPEFVWLATGGKNGAKWTEQSVCNVLKGKKVVLFPDLGAFENWKGKGLLLSQVAGCQVAVSDTLEKIATEEDRSSGLDIADYLLRNEDSTALALTDYDYPVIWDYPTHKI